MDRFTNAEKADMHFIYGVANGNGREAERLYRERFPTRSCPNHKIFQRLHRQLREKGSFTSDMHDTGRGRTTRTPETADEMLRMVQQRPGTSTRALSRATGVPRTTVWRVLHEEGLHPYHVQRVQALSATDFPVRLEFARWFLQQSATQLDFPAHVLFTDEATFTREGVLNSHNTHVWAHTNPHAIQVHSYQQRFSINVWAGIVHDHLIGPYLLPKPLNGRTYLVFLQEVLPELLQVVPAVVRNRIWFQHDGAPPHFSTDVRTYLNTTFGAQWIGRGGPIAWPPRSPDLSSLDFFLWGHLKSLMYETPIESDEDLVARLSVAAASVRDIPGVFQNIRTSLHRRCEACIRSGGRQFEQFL